MQVGLKPDEVLDMSLEVFRACLEGYSDRLFDQELLSVQQGYWSGYYSRSKKPKPFKTIFTTLVKARERRKSKNAKELTRPDVDVLAFQEMERQFQARQQELNNKDGEYSG